MQQFQVDLRLKHQALQCAFPQLSPEGEMEITGRNISFHVSMLAKPNHLNGPYVINFRRIKREVEALRLQYSQKLLVPGQSVEFAVKVTNTSVSVQRGKSTLVVPAAEVVVMPMEVITPTTLAKHFALKIAEVIGLDTLRSSGIISLTLYANNGEYSAGYEHLVESPRL